MGVGLMAVLTACEPQGAAMKSDLGPSTERTAGLDLEVHIPYEKFTLDNGLRVIVHEDRKAPIVSVGVWYHVGSFDVQWVRKL